MGYGTSLQGVLIPSLSWRGARSCPHPGNKDAQFDIVHSPPHLNRCMHNLSLGSAGETLSQSIPSLDLLGPFWGQVGWGIEKHFSTPVIVIGFISTLLCEQVPVCLSEYLVLCDAHPGSTVPSISPPTPALCP